MKRIKKTTLVRAFFAGAMLSAATIELLGSQVFSTPVEQLTVSAIAGAGAAFAAKMAGAFAVA